MAIPLKKMKMPPEGGSKKSFQPCAPHEGGSKETSLSDGYRPEKIRKYFQMPPEGGSGKSLQPATPLKEDQKKPFS
jgi:hypothetical protein